MSRDELIELWHSWATCVDSRGRDLSRYHTNLLLECRDFFFEILGTPNGCSRHEKRNDRSDQDETGKGLNQAVAKSWR